MLSTHQQAGRLRYADNLVPTADGGMATRPGAQQVLAGPIRAAQGWGNRIIADQASRIVVWDGEAHDICPAGYVLQAATFQALTSEAKRENRAYIADGVNPLSYLVRRNGEYVREHVVNSVLDENGAPYPIPVPRVVGTWRNRVFIGDGTNRIQHCQNERPDEWDPLWTLEFQGERPGAVNSICPHGTTLLAGTQNSLWAVTGDSHFNWQRDELLSYGTTGPNSIDSDQRAAFWISPQDIRGLGGEPVSEDLREMFEAPVGITELVIDTRRRLVLCLVMSRLFVMHMDRPGRFGEIIDDGITGLLRLDSTVGWYGDNGLWLLAGRDTADKFLDGTERTFVSKHDTWQERPNLGGGGTALLNRTILHLKGSPAASIHYEVEASGANGAHKFEQTGISAADEPLVDWKPPLEGKVPMPWPTQPVRREIVPRLAGESFRHTLTSDGYIEILNFEPQYRFRQVAA